MSRKCLPNAARDEEFVRAFLLQTRDTERIHGVIVEVELLESGQKGVLVVSLVAIDVRTTHNLSRPIVRYRTQYPGTQAKGLAACMFQGSQKLDTMVYEYRKVEEATSKPVWG